MPMSRCMPILGKEPNNIWYSALHCYRAVRYAGNSLYGSCTGFYGVYLITDRYPVCTQSSIYVGYLLNVYNINKVAYQIQSA